MGNSQGSKTISTDELRIHFQAFGDRRVVSQRRWSNLSTDEKIEVLHEEVQTDQSNARSLKKVVNGLIERVGEIRRYLGMNHTN